ncbi:MAG: DUF3307 domain-containing protein, partial [Elusimicrobia bacterium]|nr:DUF3307 domain-containing protein [Elusimicrobiota bacterium]
MIIFWRLLLAHFLADFTLQFDIVTRLKRKGLAGMLIHCATHLIVSIALTYQYLGQVWIDLGFLRIIGWWVMLIILVFHLVVDQARVYVLTNFSVKDNTICFLVDQVLHLLILFMVSPIYNLSDKFFGNEKWIIIITAFVIVTHVTTVLIYFIEKDIAEVMFPAFDEKYFLIFERTVLWGFFFIGGYWWIPFMLAWALQMFY